MRERERNKGGMVGRNLMRSKPWTVIAYCRKNFMILVPVFVNETFNLFWALVGVVIYAMVVKGMGPSDTQPNEEEEADCKEEEEKARPKRLPGLRDCACCFIHCKRSLVQKLGRLPFPIGAIVRQADRLAHPLSQRLEDCSLCILTAIDHKICAVSTLVKGWVMDIPAKIYRRGLLGASADIWVHYGPSIKQEMQRAIHYASRVPLLNLVIPVFCAILAPMAISMWLVKKSVIDGSTQSSSYEGLLEAQTSEPAQEFIMSESVIEGSTQSSSYEGLLEAQTSEPAQEFIMSELHGPTVVDEPFVENETEEVRESEGVSEVVSLPQQEDESVSEAVSLPQQEEEYVPDVLEMIESSWLLGASAFPLSKKASSSSQSSSGASSSSSPWKRRIFNFD